MFTSWLKRKLRGNIDENKYITQKVGYIVVEEGIYRST
jgi:hypothetical protein